MRPEFQQELVRQLSDDLSRSSLNLKNSLVESDIMNSEDTNTAMFTIKNYRQANGLSEKFF